MPARPRIGISLDTGAPDEQRRIYELPADYAEAIDHAGGLPVPLPHTRDQALQRELIAGIDGLLIPGGRDVNPRLYGQDSLDSVRLMDPLRQDFDLAMLSLAEQRNLPTLGICLGCQLMNVHRQGSLYQSITDEFPESRVVHTRIAADDAANPTRSSFHEVMLRPGTHLAAIYDAEFVRTNSRHRQAIDRLGRGLIATAFAPDGIMEAIEDQSLTFWVAVQWHPENLHGTEHERLFKALVAAARSYREGRSGETVES